MRLQTPRLQLRPLEPRDAEALLRLFSDPEVARYLWDGEVVSPEDVETQIRTSLQRFARLGFGHFVLESRALSGQIVGLAGLRPFGEPEEIEIFYLLDPAFWKQGLATEAAGEVLRFGFESLGLPEIFAGADAPNAASFRVMERLGMAPAFETGAPERVVRYYSRKR